MKINIKLKRVRKLKSFNQGDTVYVHETEESKEHMKNYGLESQWDMFINKNNKLTCEYYPTGDYPRIRVTGETPSGNWTVPRQCLYKIKYYDNKVRNNKKTVQDW